MLHYFLDLDVLMYVSDVVGTMAQTGSEESTEAGATEASC